MKESTKQLICKSEKFYKGSYSDAYMLDGFKLITKSRNKIEVVFNDTVVDTITLEELKVCLSDRYTMQEALWDSKSITNKN